jgi:hypothetical protein
VKKRKGNFASTKGWREWIDTGAASAAYLRAAELSLNERVPYAIYDVPAGCFGPLLDYRIGSPTFDQWPNELRCLFLCFMSEIAKDSV